MSKFNEARVNRICGFLEGGMTNKDAAAMSGIDKATFYRWKKDDATFATRVEASIIKYKQKLIGVMNTNAVKDGRLALEILARRWPEDFGKRQKMETIDPQAEYKRMMERIRDLPAK